MHAAPHAPPPHGVDCCRALLSYSGAARELVARLKYRNARASVRWLADGMAGLVDEPVDLVTWVPTTGARRRDRGFDQAELLARAVGRRLRTPCRPTLRRAPGVPQTGADAVHRRAGPTMHAAGHTPGTVLLVDDVTTTGATLTAAACSLKGAGAHRVVAVVAARTPRPGDLH